MEFWVFYLRFFPMFYLLFQMSTSKNISIRFFDCCSSRFVKSHLVTCWVWCWTDLKVGIQSYEYLFLGKGMRKHRSCKIMGCKIMETLPEIYKECINWTNLFVIKFNFFFQIYQSRSDKTFVVKNHNCSSCKYNKIRVAVLIEKN